MENDIWSKILVFGIMGTMVLVFVLLLIGIGRS